MQTAEPADLQLGWSRGLSLTARILAVNLFVLALLGAGLFFLDSYRVRLIAEREDAARLQATFLAESLSLVAPEKRAAYIYQFGQEHQSRIRVYAQNGEKILDSFDGRPPTYVFRDPAKEPIRKVIARGIDKMFDFLVGAAVLQPFAEPRVDTADAWQNVITSKPADAASTVA